MRHQTLPYWLAEGTESCLICTHTYVLEMEYRCTACDRGVCEQCAVILRPAIAVFCIECYELEGTS